MVVVELDAFHGDEKMPILDLTVELGAQFIKVMMLQVKSGTVVN